MSVEALASAWARTENAPSAAVVVAETEVSGRLRGGTPWTLGGTEALSMAVVLRPKIAPMQEALLWVAATFGAAEAITQSTTTDYGIVWPDRVTRSLQEPPSCFVNVVVQLRPGAIDHAVVSVRADLRALRIDTIEPGRTDLINTISEAVANAVALLEHDPVPLLAAFTDKNLVTDEYVQAALLPRGAARGRAIAVDGDGFLVLESQTGMLERIAPASLRSLEVADSPPLRPL